MQIITHSTRILIPSSSKITFYHQQENKETGIGRRDRDLKTMANNPQPATPQDLHSILSLFTTSFSSAYFQTLFPPTPAGRAYLAESWASFLSDTSPGKIYVIREGTGRVIAFALYFDEGGIVEYTTRWPKFDRFGLDGERLRAFFEGMDEQHRAAMGDGDHVCEYSPYFPKERHIMFLHLFFFLELIDSNGRQTSNSS